MPAKWAMKSLETPELRIGRILELNDPFESTPGIEGLRDDAPLNLIRYHQKEAQVHFNRKFGLLSFSSHWKQPSLWGHYADSHRGVALGFDHERHPNLYEVDYTENRPVIHPSNPDPAYWQDRFIKTLTTKHICWKPESEYRTIISLAGREYRDGNYFVGIPDEFLVLVEVILGCRCSVDEMEVEHVLKQSSFNGVSITRAKLSVDKYEVEC
jgi:hypothetical protein